MGADMIEYIRGHSVMLERVSDVIAGLAVMSWFAPLYDVLANVNSVAALITPPVGLTWLLIQIYFKVFRSK